MFLFMLYSFNTWRLPSPAGMQLSRVPVRVHGIVMPFQFGFSEILIFEHIRTQLFRTFWTYAMGKMRICSLGNIRFNLLPVSIIIPDLFAICADGWNAAQDLNFCRYFVEIFINLLEFLFRTFEHHQVRVSAKHSNRLSRFFANSNTSHRTHTVEPFLWRYRTTWS